MTKEDLENEMIQYEDEYADMCEFNCFSEEVSKKYLKKIEEIERKLKALKSGN